MDNSKAAKRNFFMVENLNDEIRNLYFWSRFTANLIMKLIYFSTLILFFVFTHQTIQAQYEITERCLLAWEQMMDLKILSAKLTIQKEIKENPTNYYAYYVDQACDAIDLVIDASDMKYVEFSKSYEARRKIMDDKDADSPYYRACNSEMMLQMSSFNVLYGDKLTGVRNGYKAMKMTNKNADEFPDFGPSKKMSGFFNVANSNLPPFVQWIVNVFGIDSDARKGFDFLLDYFNEVKDTPGLNAEAALYVMLSYKMAVDPEKAFEFISVQDSSMLDFSIVNYFYANTAYRSGSNELAYETMLNFDLTGAEKPFLPYDYLMGKILLNKLDPDAIVYFDRYLKQTKNDNYQKEIYYKTALYYLVNGDENKFMYFKLQAEEKGKEVNERDTETMYDCSFKHIPNVDLTKAKLLIEGGYFLEAKPYLEDFIKSSNDYLLYLLEYNLLMGRLEIGLGNRKRAISFFDKVIELGEDEDFYPASEAAMRAGLTYVGHDNKKAKVYFEFSRDLYDSDYYVYIDAISKRELKMLEE